MKNSRRVVGLTAPRASLLEILARQPDPVSIEAVVEATGRHPNTVREQLNWLVSAGLVERRKAPAEGRGRPAWLYFVPGERSEQDEYADLAAALAWKLSQGTDDPEAEGRVAGRRWGAELSRRRGITPAATPREGRGVIVEVMRDLGYAPEPDDRLDTVMLRHCPLLEAAHQFPEVVCSTHLGLVEAIAERAGADPGRVDLVPFAAPGACRLRLMTPR